MQTKRLRVAAQLKAASESGVIEGYGSVFGVRDSYDDIVAPGAFARTLAEAKLSGRMPAMLWQHRPDEPIGAWTEMREDDTGLFVKGQLADTQRGREALELVKLGALSGLSIGFVTKSYSYEKSTGITTLTDVDLWEVSPVTFPANAEARISAVKQIEGISNIRDAEHALREAGFSAAAARAFIARIKGLSPREAEESDDQAAMVARLSSIFR
jgi:HK97 family phage prohead protease